LIPANTKRAKANAVNAFEAFLKDVEVSLEYMRACILRDDAVHVILAVFDKFAMHRAFKKGRHRMPLKPNTVGQYFRQAKLWVLDQQPQLRPALERRLLQMGTTLENYCVARPSGGVISKAPACTKASLRQLIGYLYSNACSPTDYQDAALLCLLWYLFGRASDLTMMRRSNVSISAGDIFFLRFVRMKTSEEQGLSLFPDDDFTTRPLLALALALAVQVAPSAALLHQLPEQQQASVYEEPVNAVPLIDLINHPPRALDALERSGGTVTEHGDHDDEPQVRARQSPSKNPGIHSYVNRLLDRISAPAGVTLRLTSHSFRRGGAQHANGSATLSSSWIFDRGEWNMTTTNKAFAYVFNIPREDHMVAMVLSGFKPQERGPLASLDVLDSQAQIKIRAVSARLFHTCYKLDTPQYNVSAPVLDVLMAYLLRHYPSLKQLQSESLAVQRLETCAVAAGSSVAELLAWSAHLALGRYTQDHDTKPGRGPTGTIEDHPIVRQQAALIDQLVKINTTTNARLSALEATLETALGQKTSRPASTSINLGNEDQETEVSDPPAKRRRTVQVAYLRDVWFSWYTESPRLWASSERSLVKKKSDVSWIVAFMKLFSPDGLVLDVLSTRYRDDVHEADVVAERGLLAILDARGSSFKGSSAAVKHMRAARKAGHLDAAIRRYRALRAAGKIIDPAPTSTHNMVG